MSASDEGQKLRAAPRRKLFLPTRMRAGGEWLRVHLLDLSSTGAQVHHSKPPQAGRLVQLECGSVTRSARVVRCEGERFGIQFTMPLTDAQVEAVVAGRSDPHPAD